MNPADPASVAREFLDRLHHKEVFDKWVALPKNDPQKIGELVQQELCLPTVPTAEQLQAMSREIEGDLRDLVHKTQQEATSWTGAMFSTHA